MVIRQHCTCDVVICDVHHARGARRVEVSDIDARPLSVERSDVAVTPVVQDQT